jgi:DNA-binding SARP family transcriptional activator
MALAITLLGGFRLQRDGRTFPATWRTRKARQLLALLALAPDQRLHREQVFDLLWPDREPDAARNNFYFALHVARQVLDEGGGPTMLPLRGQLLALEPAGSLTVDLLDFEAAAARARGSGDPLAHEAALALYTGDLLPEDRYEDWATARRESAHGTWQQLLLDLGQLHADRREWDRAIDLLERITADSPTHEEAHAILMRSYALNGQRDQALRRYEQLSAALLRDLQVAPESTTQALYAAILAGRPFERGTRNPVVAGASAERGIWPEPGRTWNRRRSARRNDTTWRLEGRRTDLVAVCGCGSDRGDGAVAARASRRNLPPAAMGLLWSPRYAVLVGDVSL